MAATESKGTLPYGWVVKTSKKYPDRVYYFNISTGASTWECPELDPPRLVEDSKECDSKCTSILNRSSEEPEEVKKSAGCRYYFSENSLAKSSKIKTTENINPMHSKVPVGKNLSISPKKFMKTLETKLACFTKGTAKKPSFPVPQQKPLLPLPDILPDYNLMRPSKTSLPLPNQSKTPACLATVSQKRKSNENEQVDTNPPTAVVAPVVLEKKGSKHSSSLPANHNKVKSIGKNRRAELKKQNILNRKNLLSSKEIKQSSETRIKLSSGNMFKNKSPLTALKEGLARASNKIGEFNQYSTTTSSSENYDTDLDMTSEIEEPSNLPSTEHSSKVSISRISEIQNNSCEDIEMLDVSAELTKIDDLAVSAQATDKLCSYYIVLDTNVLIDDLNRIDEIKDTPLSGCGPPHIFIPWIVLQELDALKRSSKAAGTVSAAAQQAVRYLNKVLKSKHPRFHGQSPQEAKDCAQSYSKNNDDKILECCMSLAKKMPPEKVVLITHDKNLVNKALICKIVVHTWNSLTEEAKPDVIVVKGGSKNRRKRKNKNKTPPETPERTAETHLKTMTSPDMCKAEIHTIMSEARQLLKVVLESFLIEEMNEAYGDPWNAFPINRQLLKGILEAISKYWRTVFTFHFVEKDKRNFELLKEKVSRPEGFLGNREDCLNTLTAIEDIFCRIKRRWPQLEIPIEKVEDLRLKCNETFTKRDCANVSSFEVERPSAISPKTTNQPTEIESAVNLTDTACVLQAFENAWTVINHLCGMFMDFYHIEHNFQYEKPDSMPSEAEFRKLMINLYPCVQNIKKIMSGVVGAIKNHNPRNQIFKELYKALTELVPTLEIELQAANNPSVPNFNPQALEMYCRNPENAERVRLGYKQIEHFFSKLDQAVKVMASYKLERYPVSMALD